MVNKLLTDSKQTVSYIEGEITHICRNMKKRSPGSEGEREAAAYMKGILEKECGCADVKAEPFVVHPGAFCTYFYLTGAFGVLSTVSFHIHPLISLIFSCLTLFLFIFQFVLYKQIVDPFLPKKESVNITAVRPCSGEIRQRIFLNGHMDAAWEFPLNYHFGGVVFEIPGVAAVSGTGVFIVLSICGLLGAGDWVRIAALCGLIFIPFFILVAFTYNQNRIVDGANDNLTGCFLSIALLREMEKQGIFLEHTEIGVILTGSEEAGLRGAKAWSKRHKGDYQDVPTYILGLDTIHDPSCLMVNRRDLNSTIVADKEMGDTFFQAAQKAGVPCRTGRVPLFGGSTDSAAFIQGGFRSMCVTGLSHILEDYYHTRKDSFDNLDPEGLENCYKAVVTFVDMMEQKRT